ncbi:hypothetical protein BGW36DRAFT_457513 [Talaromyces proteolyticus]|uniref:Nephrocystin 3-like N-terminal domain-containing protein n=1 Tax=Talaromyces proteolyticus TaxID=1131652 RepID=A0AAD4KYX3_9EURO|nr:uncharacterized protein BGW36DRAFT_457513 [Talaromyces proteolyticus]KAH8703184.1 hypothetical protein BGW36DRAFT_457513 [Talaromyces proteolyticus]
MKGILKKSIQSLRRTEENGTVQKQASVTTGSSILSNPEPIPDVDDDTKQLKNASHELEQTLRLYFEKASNGNNQLQNLPFQGNELSAASDPDQLADLISKVIVTESHKGNKISRKFSSVFGKIYPVASLVIQFGTAAGEAFQPVKALMGGLDILLNLAEEERSRAGDFLKNINNITYQCSRIAELQKTIGKREWNRLVIQKSTQLLTAVIRYFNASIVFFCQNSLQILGNSVFQGTQRYSSVLESLKQAIAEYDQALLLQIALTTLSTSAKINSVIPDGKDTGHPDATTLKWLKSSYWETEAQYMNSLSRRQDGSFRWILDLNVFQQWRRRENQGLWLTAAPGFGKSTLTAYLTQLLKSEDSSEVVVLFFLFRSTNPQLRTLNNLIRTLAAQILKNVPDTQEYFGNLCAQGFESEDPSILFDTLVWTPLSGLTQQIYTVVDGLDECCPEQSSSLAIGQKVSLDVSDMLQKLPGQCFMTSRPISIPTAKLEKCLHHRLLAENSDDIEAYVSKRVAQSSVLQKGFNTLSKDPSIVLVEKAQGNFLWAFTVLGLLDKPSLSIDTFESFLTSVPENLNQVYNEVLGRLDRAGSLELAKLVAGCVLFGVSTMTVDMLQAVVCIIHGEVFGLEEFIEAECGSILTIASSKSPSNIIQPVHETFKKFITSNDALNCGRLSSDICHLHFTIACLECLLDSENLQYNSLHEYACQNWFTHFTAFQNHEEAYLGSEYLERLLLCLHTFFTSEQTFCTWLRELLLLVQDDTRARFFCFELVDMHSTISEWLISLNTNGFWSNLSSENMKSESLSKASQWSNRQVQTQSQDLAQFISKCVAQTWLRTNWKESSLSHWIFLQTKKTAQMLLWDDPEGISGPKRYVRSISHSDFSSTTIEEARRLGTLGNFVPLVGVQAGNYAFGCLAANDPSCERFFLSALDEHPEWWHLHETLGEWYYRNDNKKQAMRAFENAIEYDPKSPSSATHMYWTTKCEICLDSNDLIGAVETLKRAEEICLDGPAFKYWDRMARIWKDHDRWDEVKTVYTDALRKRTVCRDEYWMGLVEANEKLRDSQGVLDTLISALQDDPKNSRRYGNKLCRFASELAECMLFDESISFLCLAIEIQPNDKREYHMLLAKTYMGARKWEKAAEAYEAILLEEEKNVNIQNAMYSSLGDAYLAMGKLKEAKAAIEKANISDPKLILPDTFALGYLIDNQFSDAIRILKRCISQTHSDKVSGIFNAIQAGMVMNMHLVLGKAYKAAGRDAEESHIVYEAGIAVFDKLKEDVLKNIPKPEDQQVPVWRCDARVLMIYGELLLLVGRLAEALQQYEAAYAIISKTRFVEDDDILEWEYGYCQSSLERARLNLPLSMQAEREVIRKTLELRISNSYRTEWYSFMKSSIPRFRGGENGWSTKILGVKTV